MFTISNLRCEYAVNPLGIETTRPRFSWILEHPERAQRQTAYQIQVASTLEQLLSGKPNLWDSGKTVPSQLPLVEYAGEPLNSRQYAYWRVRAWDKYDLASGFSEPAWFEVALLEPEDWSAEWIGFPAGWNGKALYFRELFEVEKPIAKARAYVVGLGCYELHLNGEKTGARVLDPAQTDYSRRVLYSIFDIRSQLRVGQNVVGVIIGNGWHGTPKLLVQLELHYTDGSSARVVTGRRGGGGSWWRVADGPIRDNSIFDGEVYDARLERPGWDTAEGFSENFPNLDAWAGAMAVEAPAGKLIPQTVEPIHVVETRLAQALYEPQPGIYVYDLGQNLTGWAAITATGQAGTTVTLRFAEVLNDDGTVNQQNLRSARACDQYILKGEGHESWEPRFTYHGFRYVQLEGFPGNPTLGTLHFRIVRSSVEPTGEFECSHPMLEQLHRVIWWTEASNLHGIPTDCPQRNERMGWLNDMAARTEEALYNFDLVRLLSKWMNDIADTQDEAGAIADTAPYRWGCHPADPVAVCYLLIPWLLYRHYGDQRVLETHYDGMKRWVAYLTQRAPGCIVDYSYYGDWAPPLAESLSGSQGTSAVSRNTPGQLVSTAFYAYSVRLFAEIASALGRTEDATAYAGLAQEICTAFNEQFWDGGLDGYGTNNQACNALALYMDLVPEERKLRVIENLVRDIREHDFHLTTGNLCTKYVLEALSTTGHNDAAFALATQTTYPSWGFMLLNGATTLWERWEKVTGHGMNSHNHPMLGSVGAWLYRFIGGIQLPKDAYGFASFQISPLLLSELTFARSTIKTIRGEIKVTWQLTGDTWSLVVRIPVGSQACIVFPRYANRNVLSISEDDVLIWQRGKALANLNDQFKVEMTGEKVSITVGSGTYDFLAWWE